MFQNLVWSFAEELGVQINMANQIPLLRRRPFPFTLQTSLTYVRVLLVALALSGEVIKR